MMLSRRDILWIGGGILAGLSAPGSSLADEAVEMSMRGNADGSHVWFDPIGLHIEPGRTLRWTNRDPGNTHTVTAYHPQNFGHPLRIPGGAEPWNSDYLLPNESFSVTLTLAGVYDFFCIPHEHAGMVGRIIVGQPAAPYRKDAGSGPDPSQEIPEAALRAFPSIEEIMRQGIVRPS